MKNRWFLSALFALTLCACVTPAQAAVISGGTEYVWYTGEEGLYVSDDQGGSYGVLPELETARKRTGLSYVITVQPNAANDGGLSVKGRDIWSTQYTWFRDYSAWEIAAALKNTTKVTPVRVHATNGTVTVGSRYVMDEGNDDPTQPGTLGTNLLTGAYAGDRIVYSTDGVTWLPAEGEGELNWLGTIWWDGEAFRSRYGGLSADGVHWSRTEEEWTDPTFSLACELGPYRFEYAVNAAGEAGVYLMNHTSPETGVLLPHITEAAKANWVRIGRLRAWYGPNDTVILAAYDVDSKENLMVSIDYPISSLDWCLENLRTQFRYLSTQAHKCGENEHIGLALLERGYERELFRWEDGWQWAAPPFQNVEYLYPYNGKTFMVRADGKLYASEDGLAWESLEGRGLGDEWDSRKYCFTWIGDRYISCRRTVEYSSGRAGTWGERYDPACTQVTFLNERFETVDSYDFGRQVKAVGYLDGTYYAEVSDSVGVSTNDYQENAPSTLYRSADGKAWIALDHAYLDDFLVTPTNEHNRTRDMPTRDSAKPLRTVAQLDDLRFALMEKNGQYTVGVMLDSALHWEKLEGMEEAIRDNWIIPGEVTAQYDGGRVRVTVTDLSTPGMRCSRTYPASELRSLRFGEKTWDWQSELTPVKEQSKPGVADVALLERLNGERELIFRNADTEGKYQSLNSVPWSNSIELLPFSGKDFFVLDPVEGKLYRSSDGVNWSVCTSSWARVAGDYVRYALVWTGNGYLGYAEEWRYTRKVAPAPVWTRGGEVWLLDENLNELSHHSFGRIVEKVGYTGGVYYAQTGDTGMYSPEGIGGNVSGNPGYVAIWRSSDGVHWEETDILTVRECLRGLQ